MSSERGWARRAAQFYGSQVAQKSRAERIELLRAKIAELERSIAEQNEAHMASCEKCQRARGQNPFDDFCFYRFEAKPEWDRIQYLRSLTSQEQADELYARQARENGVDYREHIDGFCRYWQNLRHRKFVAADWKCERCGKETGALEAHHLHYETVGFEELSDLMALCPSCHKASHHR